MQVAAGTRHAREFGDDAIRLRDGVYDMAGHDEIEGPVRRAEFVNALMLEFEPRRELRVA